MSGYNAVTQIMYVGAQVCYLGYEEWESNEKLHDHFKSDTHKDWLRFVHESNIASKVCMAVEIKDMSPFEY